MTVRYHLCPSLQEWPNGLHTGRFQGNYMRKQIDGLIFLMVRNLEKFKDNKRKSLFTCVYRLGTCG